MKTSNKKLRAMITEERASAKDYSRRGFPKLAKDERRHADVLEAKLRSRKK